MGVPLLLVEVDSVVVVVAVVVDVVHCDDDVHRDRLLEKYIFWRGSELSGDVCQPLHLNAYMNMKFDLTTFLGFDCSRSDRLPFFPIVLFLSFSM